MAFYTPLRYPGGKRKLFDFFRALIEFNNLKDCTYIEPYAGGAGLALSLLFEGYVKYLHLNDINPSVYAFWRAVLNETDSLCRMIMDTPVTMEEWYRQKDIQRHPQDVSCVSLGFSTFFLNRTNRSGILKGGVIGGKKQNGKWTLDMRYSKSELIKRIQNIAMWNSRICFSNTDAEEYLKRYNRATFSNPLLFYCDPPYYEMGAALYDNFYDREDHVRVANRIMNLPWYWVVSYDNHAVIREIYKEYKAITYSLSYTAQTKKKGAEFMAFSNSLQLPEFCVSTKGRYFSLLYSLKMVA